MHYTKKNDIDNNFNIIICVFASNHASIPIILYNSCNTKKVSPHAS